MSETPFEHRIQELADEAGITIAELRSNSARLTIPVDGLEQNVFVVDYDGLWEFSCPTFIGFDEIEDFPQPLLALVLEQNARCKRGFWCIDEIGGKKCVQAMHNIESSLLTPDEFANVCTAVARQVVGLESILRMVFGL